MNKFFTFALILLCFHGQSQKLSTSFQPVIKEVSPVVKIIQHTDGNYLVYGYMHYIGETPSGSMIRIDSKGRPVNGIQRTFTDGTILMVKVLPSGKILVLGDFRYVNGVRVPCLVRLNADGSLDPGFHLDITERIDLFEVMSTGKIITSVNLGLSGGNLSKLVRLDGTGHTDATYNSGLAPGLFSSIAVDQQDNVLISYGNYIRRVLADGGIDNTFTDIDLSPSPKYNPGVITLQHDGKILTYTGTNPYRILRFNSTGTPDISFHSVEFNGGWIWSIVEKQDRKIMAAGGFTSVDGNTAYAAELSADGSYSKSILIPNTNLCYGVYEDIDQNVFVTGGFESINEHSMPSIVKLEANYEVDFSFAPGISRAPSYGYPNSVAVQSSGKMLVGGLSATLGGGNNPSRLVRLLPDGSADSTFHAAIPDPRPDDPDIRTIVVQEDDKIIVGGYRVLETISASFGRLLPDGQLDSSFELGTGPAFSGVEVVAVVNSVVVKNSRIYVAGFFDSFDGQALNGLAILDKDGELISPQQNGIPANSNIRDIAVQSSGKIVVVGNFPVGPGDDRNFIRINPDGSRDDSFQLIKMDGGFADLEVDDQDNILLAGFQFDNQSNAILRRFTPEGVMDGGLNLGAGFLPEIGTNSSAANFVALLPGNKMAIGGRFSGYNNIPSPAFVLLDHSGALIPVDNPFDSTSFILSGAYNKSCNIVVMKGYLTRDHGQILSSGTKLVFPVVNTVSDFKVKTTSESAIALSWKGSYTGADKVVVEQSTPGTTSYSKVAILSPNATSFSVNGLNEVTPYFFRITGSNDGYTGSSFVDHDTTGIAPEIALPATDITSNSFTANWNYLAGTDSTMLQVSGDNFSTFVPGFDQLVLKTGTKPVTGLKDGKAYQYRIKRYKNKQASAYSPTITVEVITGLEDKRGTLDVRAYPNPVRESLTLDLPENSELVTAMIHSTEGEVIGNYSFGKGLHSEIDTHSLSPGMYVLTVSCGRSYRKFKVIKTGD